MFPSKVRSLDGQTCFHRRLETKDPICMMATRMTIMWCQSEVKWSDMNIHLHTCPRTHIRVPLCQLLDVVMPRCSQYALHCFSVWMISLCCLGEQTEVPSWLEDYLVAGWSRLQLSRLEQHGMEYLAHEHDMLFGLGIRPTVK